MDWSVWQQLFRIGSGRVHLNHAGVSPISTRVVETVKRFIGDAAEFDTTTMREWERYAETVRDGFAGLVGARADEIAFVKNTSEGLSLVAAGLDWRDGDNVIVVDGEYPSNVYPWWGLRRHGVETRMAKVAGPVVSVDDLRALADANTRLVSVSFVDWNLGGRADLAAIGTWCRERGILFCVDGIQGVGALPLDVESAGIDFLAVGGHKWLLAPEGCGCLFVSRRVVDRLHSVLLGWKSVTNSDTYLPYHFDLRPNASKLESGTAPLLGTVALGAAIDLIHELGVARIEARLLELNDRLAEGVARLGGEIASPWRREQRSGIAIVRSAADPQAFFNRLQRAGFVLRMRGGGVRVAPHFYTSEAGIDRFLEVMAEALRAT